MVFVLVLVLFINTTACHGYFYFRFLFWFFSPALLFCSFNSDPVPVSFLPLKNLFLIGFFPVLILLVVLGSSSGPQRKVVTSAQRGCK